MPLNIENIPAFPVPQFKARTPPQSNILCPTSGDIARVHVAKPLDPPLCRAPNRGAMVPRKSRPSCDGEKWEYGESDPIRGSMPEPPPRL
ncbi:hypothetical protein GCM10022404_09250 [Celeribacter arenosi]|uniref:Uncharacterized protein n=1 Tax=Celeribacter arenosi TaxID=792649 RepID=A0ABP7JZE6_9RHOB